MRCQFLTCQHEMLKDSCNSPDAKNYNANARRYSDDIGIRNCVVRFMLLSAGDNRCLNRSGDILRYLKNCSRSSFNSLNKVLNTPETEHLRKISCNQKHCFCFSFVCFCFFNFKSRKHKIVYLKTQVQYIIVLKLQSHFF